MSMADEPENLMIRLLQEIRTEMREMRGDLTGRVDGLSTRVDDLSTRVDGNAVILNMLAGMWHSQDERITKLEAGQKLG